MKIYELSKNDKRRNRKKIFLKNYDPDIEIDIKKTAQSFGVSIQMVYRWMTASARGRASSRLATTRASSSRTNLRIRCCAGRA